MSEYLVQCTLTAVSGLPEDDVVNTFAIDAVAGWDPVVDAAQVVTPVSNFYSGAQGNGGKVSDYLGTSLSRAAGAGKVDIYDISAHLDGSPHGSPVASGVFTLGAPTGTLELPREVAAVLTFRATGYASALVEAADGPDAGTAVDRPRQRRTGRMFIGPLRDNTLVVATNGVARWIGAFSETLRLAGAKLSDDLDAAGHVLAVWSRADEDLRPVSHVQTDDAPDTIRSRGVAPTARITLAV